MYRVLGAPCDLSEALYVTVCYEAVQLETILSTCSPEEIQSILSEAILLWAKLVRDLSLIQVISL